MAPRLAQAQACCAAASALGQGRLTLHEEYLVGVDLRATRIVGAFADDARYRKASSTQAEFEEGLFASMRIWEKGQLSLRLPFVQNYFATPTETEFGGGIGDMQASARWDFIMAGESLRIPGIAVTGGVVAPTGRPVEKAESFLGTDATGTGASQLALGLGLEQTFGGLYLGLTSTALYRLPRTARGHHVEGSLQISELAAIGWTFDSEAVVIGSALFTLEPEASKHSLRLALSGALPIHESYRLQGGLFGDMPIDALGRNQSVGVGLQFGIIRSWI